MKKNTRILLYALVVLMIGAISFNFTNTTGKVVSGSNTIITVSPKIIKAGEPIYINVKPGKQGVLKEIEFYRADKDLRLGGKSADVCRSSKCFEASTVKYNVERIWDNNDKWGLTETSRDYYVRVYDIYTGKWVRSYFTVNRYYEAAGPDEHR